MGSGFKTGGGQGSIFNIQRFCVHDGPGIRTTVFMKGCPLRCQWCANPESQQPGPILITRDVKCVSCGKCVEVCPTGAISFDQNKRRIIDWELCNQCLKCAEVCLYGSLGGCGKTIGAEELVAELLKDEPFFKRSGGGVTISGGEPLVQPEFVLGLVEALRAKDIHVALDTSGYAPAEVFARLADNVDLVLFDIKHLNDQKHRQFTGVGNQKILANASYAAGHVRTWFRMPVIPGFNDSPEYVRQVAALCSDLKVEKISLLPYHEGGKTKFQQIGRTYLLPDVLPPADEHIQLLQNIFAEAGVQTSVQR